MSNKGVDGRGRYGNEVGNSLRSKRERETNRWGRKEAASPEYIRGGQGLAEG